MVQRPSLIGPNLFMDRKGQLFEKTAGDYKPIINARTQAEDRFVERNLGKGVLFNEKD